MVLPLLALLLVMAVDFGRVFFGWIALQNTVRIGADYAAQTESAWPDDPSDPPPMDTESVNARAAYQTLMTNDLQAANCEYPDPFPPPTFEDTDDPPNGESRDWGDHAVVTVPCDFALITPLAETILGGPVNLTATATFAIHGTVIAALPDPPPPPCEEPEADIDSAPAPLASGRIEVSGPNPTVTFTDATFETADCPITFREWDFDHDGETSNLEVVSHDFPPHTGGGHTTYNVVLEVQTDMGTDTATVEVRVRE